MQVRSQLQWLEQVIEAGDAKEALRVIEEVRRELAGRSNPALETHLAALQSELSGQLQKTKEPEFL